MNLAGDCRLLIEDQPCSGPWNMALDEALLDDSLDTSLVTLRLYRWQTATISLGYFQSFAEFRGSDSPLAKLPAVRRLSGGGAILHDQEWTYSLQVPRERAALQDPLTLYQTIHEPLIDVLRSRGVDCELRGESRAFADKPFLCFGRGDARDVVCGQFKIVGSAQRRRRGAILQHGSILIRQSRWAPQFSGIEDLGAQGCWERAFADELSSAIIDRLRLNPVITIVSPEVLDRARELADTKYSEGL